MGRDHSGHAWLFAFVDVLLVLAVVQMSYTLLVLPQINPPAKEQQEPPGNISVLACWPEGAIDVDLWTDAPGQKKPTGYSTKSGEVWSLLRDDLGTTGDSSIVNCENAYARAAPAGEYVVNIHGYSLPTGQVPVRVEVAMNGRLLVQETVNLRPKQERTVIRFTLDGSGAVGSSNKVFKPLRSEKK